MDQDNEERQRTIERLRREGEAKLAHAAALEAETELLPQSCYVPDELRSDPPTEQNEHG